MPKKIILHVGTFKTGTSLFQNTLWINREQLLSDYRVLYPATGLIHGEQNLGVRHSDLTYYHGDPAVDWAGLMTELVAEIRLTKARTTIISCESWSRIQDREQNSLKATVEYLVKSNFCVEVVAFLREEMDYAKSYYKQMTLHRGNVLPFDDFCQAHWRTLTHKTITSALWEAVKPFPNASLKLHPWVAKPDAAEAFKYLMTRVAGAYIATAPFMLAMETNRSPDVDVELVRAMTKKQTVL